MTFPQHGVFGWDNERVNRGIVEHAKQPAMLRALYLFENPGVHRDFDTIGPVLRQARLEPAARVIRPVWTPKQLAAFLRHASSDRLGAAYHLIGSTGLRRGELCGLRWQDVDLDGGTLSVRQQHVQVGKRIVVGPPKTKAGAREVALDGGTVIVLRTHKAAQAAERLVWGAGYNDGGLLFAREDGTPLRPEYVTRHFLDLAEQAGSPRIVLHGLRHTWATHALAAGVDMLVVSGIWALVAVADGRHVHAGTA